MGHYLLNCSKKGAAKGEVLREQAAELLEVKLWGIGAKTPNRLSLAPGRPRTQSTLELPSTEFIGHAELATGTHEWQSDEAMRYPGSFEGGIALREAATWAHPVSMKTVLTSLELAGTKPGAHFFSGVIRITERDYETVVAAASGTPPGGSEGSRSGIPNYG